MKLLCRLGMHSRWVDTDIEGGVQRCNNCDWVSNPADAKALDARRERRSRIK